MPDEPKAPPPFTLKDRFGVAWVVKPHLKKIGPVTVPSQLAPVVYDVMLLNEAAYNTNPQTTVISLESTPESAPDKIAEEIEAYIRDHLANGGQPPKRVELQVTASPDKGGWVLLVLLGFVLLSKKGRR